MTSWKEKLGSQIQDDWGEEIDVFAQQMVLRRQGKLAEKIFAETRLRRGVYGQRYDNGKRNDGLQDRALAFPCGDATKGPGTVWDAPGMLRIKIPYGALTIEQVEVLADLSEEYSDNISHITTRQDIQYHYIHIEDSPDLMRRLAATGITTREACGNVVRNVTACPFAGVCGGEAFDVSTYADALTFFILGHPDCQDFGRKIKIAFSGCETSPCGLTMFHDIGLIAKRRIVDGIPKNGFAFYVGGGLGSVPSQAKLLNEFVPEEEIFPVTLAVCRVFGRLGEKDNRTCARLKFLIKSLGMDEFTRLVEQERKILPHDERWAGYLKGPQQGLSKPTKEPSTLAEGPYPDGFKEWVAVNVKAQRQVGYATVTAVCPLGDLSANQMRSVADIARVYVGDNIRLTVEQNLVFRWVTEQDLPALFVALQEAGLAQPSAGTIVDVTSCPGTDTCKLGHASSRGLAAVLREQLAAINSQLDEAVKELRIKVSGCFNSCGQHHAADIGFYGVGRKVKGYMVPHFQVVLGGQWDNNAGSFGLAIGAVPSRNIPLAVRVITTHFVEGREPGEKFKDFIQRLGKPAVKKWIKELTAIPAYDVDRSFYSDWGDSREYSTGDLGIGECAGEVVTLAEFGLSESERQVFDAQLHLDKGVPEEAAQAAFKAMLTAARSLVRIENIDVPDQAEHIVTEFRNRYHETRVFHDPFAGAKFTNYFFRQYEEQGTDVDHETAHHRIEEAQLFIEAAYGCYARLGATAAA
ncbi:MAG: nitrite/sulfite reductase [Deltaproteobacteria bacterium]|nr:nitrite/sulfite reductase [Deltaproteobacteria bacterium]